jgi:hypothetical protein
LAAWQGAFATLDRRANAVRIAIEEAVAISEQTSLAIRAVAIVRTARFFTCAGSTNLPAGTILGVRTAGSGHVGCRTTSQTQGHTQREGEAWIP